MTVEDRRANLLAGLAPDVDAIVVTKLVNVRYLTGFTGSNGALLVTRDRETVFATDGRYEQQVAAEAPGLPVRITRAPAADLVTEAARAGVRRLGFEAKHVSVAAHDRLVGVADGMQLVGCDDEVERLRVRKDDEEVGALRAACKATDDAFAAVLSRLRPGVTEREVAWALLEAMHAAGAEGAAFESIVAFGPHSAVPHHQPTDRPLESGDLVKLDFGAKVDGYHADMTRTVVCGRAQDWQRDLHGQVEAVQARCRQETVVGAVPVELDALAQELVRGSGHRLVHGLGHGVGLEIHEEPFLVPHSAAARLDDRVPVTVEPGIYLPGQGGVRVEDTVLVGPGGAEALTTSPRDLLEI